jgi:hypothetical protein
MDILVPLVFAIVAKIWLLHIKASSRRKKKKQREPIGALLFGSWYYWLKVNLATTNRR